MFLAGIRESKRVLMGGGFPIKAFGNDNLVLTKVGIVLTEVGNGQCITYLPNIYRFLNRLFHICIITPFPVLCIFDQPRLNGIVYGIPNNTIQFLFITNHTIIAFVLPECTSAVENFIYLSSSRAFY